jgi:hypothetical protein
MNEVNIDIKIKQNYKNLLDKANEIIKRKYYSEK